MKHISILVPQGAILGSVEGPRQLLTQVNQFCMMQGQPPLFDVKLVGLHAETPLSGGSFTAHAAHLISDVTKTDLIIIPAVDGDPLQAVEKNKDFLPWITQHYNRGAEVASLCVGAFILASTGLVDGKKCATHWLAENQFRKAFPQVNLIAEKIVTDEDGIYSSGGAYSYLNLILYIIEKYVNRETAVLCAKVFALEIDRDNQSAFMMFTGIKEHGDEPIREAQHFIENHYQEKITVDQLASMFALGRRNLERRFKKATDNTVVEYIQRVKIEAAKMSLEKSTENVNEVMYKVGYNDSKAFRTTFKKITGLSPLEYRNRYNTSRAVA
jgi:transcriptional regulator GlxA family with amidase domain